MTFGSDEDKARSQREQEIIGRARRMRASWLEGGVQDPAELTVEGQATWLLADLADETEKHRSTT